LASGLFRINFCVLAGVGLRLFALLGQLATVGEVARKLLSTSVTKSSEYRKFFFRLAAMAGKRVRWIRS